MAPSPSLSLDDGLDFDVENADYIAQILTSDVLATKIGKHALKVIYTYVKNNQDWILQKFNFYEESEVRPQRMQLPGQNLEAPSTTLLHQMFHIGHQPFDALLTENVRVDYSHWLQTPLGITPERAWLQISKRYEFSSTTKLNLHDASMVALIVKHFSGNL